MQVVFKPMSSISQTSYQGKIKLAISRHTPVFCVFCETLNAPGEETFKTCSRCMTVRYCSREHQAKHWPIHKAVCHTQTELLPSQSSSPSSHPGPHSSTSEELDEPVLSSPSLPLPTITQRAQIEDFVRLHHYILSRVLCTAVLSPSSTLSPHSSKPSKSFDFQNQMAVITLSPRLESNPARVFSLDGIHFEPIPKEGTDMGNKIATLRKGMESADMEDRSNRDYVGLLLCIYHIPKWNMHWTSPRSLFISDFYTMPGPNATNWRNVGKMYLDLGIVYRLVPVADSGAKAKGAGPWTRTRSGVGEVNGLQWRSGTLAKSKGKWMWVEGNFDGIRNELERSVSEIAGKEILLRK